jgi:hypothetical protein
VPVTEERRNNALILHLAGDFGSDAPDLDQALQGAIADDSIDVIVDLSEVGAFRPARSLTAAERQRRDLGGRRRFAVVADPDTDVRVALMLSGFTKIAPIFDTIDDVLQAWETDGMPI